MDKDLKYAVLGSGSWATALIKLLTENKSTVYWYVRNSSTVKFITEHKHNPSYLTSVELNTNQIQISSDINKIVSIADVLIFAIPSAFIGAEANKIKVSISSKVVVSAVKGIVPETGQLVAQYFNTSFGIPLHQMVVVAGPCHAEEVALERLSFLTIACQNSETAKEIALRFKSDYMQTNTTDDLIGIEYAAVLKNIYAIASGVAHGLGYGDNFQSVLISNATREMKRFIKRVYKMKRNINETAYLGDLLVTAYSVFSRNRMFGNMVGKGYTVKSAQMEMNMVAEGYYATKSAFLLCQQFKEKTKTPIIAAVHAILYENKNPKKVFKKLVEKLD
jgi:glycerol-3-phosphate dehydrogenase (NAD(P)+)